MPVIHRIDTKIVAVIKILHTTDIVVVAPEEEEDEGCYDDVLKKYIARGATVVHPGAPSKGQYFLHSLLKIYYVHSKTNI